VHHINILLYKLTYSIIDTKLLSLTAKTQALIQFKKSDHEMHAHAHAHNMRKSKLTRYSRTAAVPAAVWDACQVMAHHIHLQWHR
jgi:hypothetical protein